MLAYHISACEACIIWRKPTEALKNPSPIAESRTGKPTMVALKIQLDCSTVRDMTLWANIIVRSHLGCWTNSVSIRFFAGLTNISKRKSDANQQDLEIKWNLKCQFNQPSKTIWILTKLFCTSGPNLVVLAWTRDELSRGQAQNGVSFDLEVNFDLEGQCQSPPKTIRILTKAFYTYGPYFLAWTGPELSHGQTSDWHRDWQTHRRRQRQYS